MKASTAQCTNSMCKPGLRPCAIVGTVLAIAGSSIGHTPTESTLFPRHAARVLQQEETTTSCDLIPDETIADVWSWASTTYPRATGMIVYQNGVKRFEEYDESNICTWCGIGFLRSIFQFLFVDTLGWAALGGSPTSVLNMHSMTKTISGLTALLLQKQGYIPSLDEPVATYIPEWENTINKSTITIRELISFSSGLGSFPDTPLLSNNFIANGIFSPFVGRRFAYGSQPHLVFAKVVQVATGQDPEDYVRAHLLDPLGIEIEFRRTKGRERLPVFSTSARATLQDIAILGGELLAAAHGDGIVFNVTDIASLTTPGLNPPYGLAVWLNDNGVDAFYDRVEPSYPSCGTTDVFSALGKGGQFMTIVPEHQMVIVKSALDGFARYKDLNRFLLMLFSGQSCQCNS